MRKFIGVLNSDRVNRYGMRFTVGSLEKVLRDSLSFGIPCLIGHDFHRPVGWVQGLSLCFEPGLVCLTGLYFTPENSEEREMISDLLQSSLSEQIARKAEPHRQGLEAKTKMHLSGNEILWPTDCAAIYDKGILKRMFPDIFKQQDKNGLVPLSTLTLKSPGVFEKNGLVFFAHPYFRRSLSRLNTINAPFFRILQEKANALPIETRIALDEDLIGLANTFVRREELAYWWGPKFSEDISKIPVGVTRHDADGQQKYCFGISRTEFWWYSQDRIRTFECEELKDIPSFGISKDKFGCRFVHCMTNSSSKAPVHLDGAIRLYDKKSLMKRLEKDIQHSGRHSEYKKLWRIDGPLSITDWKELITHYFRDNCLIGEYFGGKDDSMRDFRQIHSISTSDQNHSKEDISLEIAENQCIRLSLSYHPRTENADVGRFIPAFDTFTSGKKEYHYIESDTIELIKLLKRMNEQISLPSEKVRVIFKDRILNFPLILHLGTDSVSLALKTQETIAKICELFVKLGNKRIVSYNIGIQYSYLDAYFSIAGPVSSVCTWLNCQESIFPSQVSELEEWSEKASKILSEKFSNKDSASSLTDILQKSGLLVFERHYLNPGEYSIDIDEKSYEPSVKVNRSVISPNFGKMLDSGRLRADIVYLIEESMCSKCQNSYLLCNCSKYFDANVTHIIKKCEPLGAFWVKT